MQSEALTRIVAEIRDATLAVQRAANLIARTRGEPGVPELDDNELAHRVEQAARALESIDHHARGIVDVACVVDNAVTQTDALLLEAAVEATRMTDSGLGVFAEIAIEVRDLAERNADVAREVRALLGQEPR